MEHLCDKQEAIEEIARRVDSLPNKQLLATALKSISAVKKDLDAHRLAQMNYERKNSDMLNSISMKIDIMSPTVKQVQDIENAAIMGKKVISGIVWMISATGGIWLAYTAVKDLIIKK